MVTEIERTNIKELTALLLTVQFYQIKNDQKNAFKSITKVQLKKYNSPKHKIIYYHLFSDLAWEQQYYIKSAEISEKAIEFGHGREVDFERVAIYYEETTQREKLPEMYLAAFETHKKGYFFIILLTAHYRSKNIKH